MPKCLVDYCHNYIGKNYGNVILHVFPTTRERIKVWLRSIEQSGQVFENIDEMAVEIQENKRNNVYRVCCEHFTSECYVANGEKKILKKDAVPTIFTPKTKESVKRCTEDPEQKSQEQKQVYKENTDDREMLTQKVLNLTLEIIYLLTGEDYIVVKNNSNQYIRRSSTKDNSPNLLILESNRKKILGLTDEIIELLTGEVPIRYEDITVNFTMEEWEYIEGHKDLYKDVLIDHHQPLTSPGGPCNEIPPHIREPCSDETIDKDFSIQLNQFNGRQFTKECHNATRNMTKISYDDRGAIDPAQRSSLCIKEGQGSCEGVTEFEYPTFFIKEELCPDDEESATDNTYSCSSKGVVQQHPHTNIKVEPWDGGEYASNSYMPTDHTYFMTTHIKEDPFTCNEENVLDYNIDTQHCPTTYIKEEPVSYDGVNLTDPNIDIPIGHTCHPSTHIKEEPDPCDRVNLTDPNIDLPNHHTYHSSTHIKEEPDSYDGVNLTGSNIDLPNHYTYHPSTHNKEEPDSCDGVNLTDPIMHIPIHPTYPLSTRIKEEPDSYEGVNLTDPNIDIPIHHMYHPSNNIKEDPDSYNRENITDLDNSCPPIKKELWDGDNVPNPNIYIPPNHTQQYSSIPAKVEPVSCDFTETGYTTVFSKEDNKDVLDKNYSCIPRNPIPQSLSTGSKIETIVKWSLTGGPTGEKANSSSLVRNVVIAHLLEMKQGNTNNPQANSQSQACIASTSTVKHEVRETRLEHLSSKNGPGSTQRIYVKKRPTKEAEGEKTFGDISNLTKYLRANSKKKTPQCSQCGQYFLRKTQLEAHVRIHAGQNPFECVDCGKCFLNNDQLVEHQKTHNGGFTCSVCEKSFQKESSLVKHQKIHKGEKPFQCPECGKCFSIYYELHVHKKTHTEDKKHKCSKCGKSYSSKVQFDVHMRTHTGERPYGCTGCGRRFMEKKKLLIHQKLHAGLTPHECPECGKRFALRSNLIIHRRIHTGRKPAVCFQCGKSFSTRSSLIRHIVTHSKLRQCSILDLEKNQQTDSAECQSASPNSREESAVKVLLGKGRRMQK